MYVSEEGTFEIYVGSTYYGSFGPGIAFGELALLYSTKRLCSIDGTEIIIGKCNENDTLIDEILIPFTATTNGKLWVLERHAFQAIMAKSSEESLKYNLKLLRRIEMFKDMPEESLLKICDLIVVVRQSMLT